MRLPAAMTRRTARGKAPPRRGRGRGRRTMRSRGWPSARHVAGPTTPSAGSPRRRWKRPDRARGRGPKTPSAGRPQAALQQRDAAAPRGAARPARRAPAEDGAPGRAPDDAVGAQVVAALEGLDGPDGARAEHAVGGEAEGALELGHPLALDAALERARLGGGGDGDEQRARGDDERAARPLDDGSDGTLPRCRGEHDVYEGRRCTSGNSCTLHEDVHAARTRSAPGRGLRGRRAARLPPSSAAVAELVDARRSGRRERKLVGVRVPSAASTRRGSADPRARACYPPRPSAPLSSRGLGRRPLTAETGVRIPVAVLLKAPPRRGFLVPSARG